MSNYCNSYGQRRLPHTRDKHGGGEGYIGFVFPGPVTDAFPGDGAVKVKVIHRIRRIYVGVLDAAFDWVGLEEVK